METAITDWETTENFFELKRNLIDSQKNQTFSDDEQDFQEFAKEMDRVWDQREDSMHGGKCSNASSNNNSFIEMNPHIWHNKDDRRDDSLVFFKNFEKIKKQKKKSKKPKNKKFQKLANIFNEGSNSIYETAEIKVITQNKNKKLNKKPLNLKIENDKNCKNLPVIKSESPVYKNNESNFKKSKNNNTSNSPVSATTCWSSEFKGSNDSENSDEGCMNPPVYNLSGSSRNYNICNNFNYCKNLDNYFHANENYSNPQLDYNYYMQPVPSPIFQNLYNFTNSNPSKNPFECLQSTEIIGKGNKKQLDEAANRINRENILRGKDKRTTLMIRHIPNKYSLHTMIEDFNVDFKGKFDVFYLPIDYINNCNLGFAFINFVDSMHILQFYDTFRGKKWRRFNSEKICELAYAKFQGKKELIAHFEKGSIMNFESEDKKPLILPTPNPLPPIEIPLKYFEAFITVYPYANVEIQKTKFIVNSLYAF